MLGFYKKMMEEIGIKPLLRDDGIIFKRDPHKLSEEELKYLADNSIPY